MYSWSPNLSQNSLKNSVGKVFFSNFGWNQNDAKQWKSVIWPPFWNGTWVQIFYIFSWNMVVISIYIYGVKIIKNTGEKVVFSWNPRSYALTEVRGTLCVNVSQYWGDDYIGHPPLSNIGGNISPPPPPPHLYATGSYWWFHFVKNKELYFP